MKLGTLWKMLGGTSAPLYIRAMRLSKPIHRAAWLGSAAKHDILSLLSEPRTLHEVIDAVAAPPARHEAVRAWLTHGCLLGELRLRDGRYQLRSALAKGLADPEEDLMASFVQGLSEIHHRAVFGLLDNLEQGRTLDDIDHELVAAISELAAPMLQEVIDTHVPREGDLRFLELGCGTARTLRQVCTHNPRAHGTGIDLDPAVAANAQHSLEQAGLTDRARVLAGDLRTIELDETFDRVTLFNLIYYFPLDQRAQVLARAARWLEPGGQLLLTSMCRGGTFNTNMLDLWFSSLRECGPLPTADDLVTELSDAGLTVARPASLMPGDAYMFVRATKPA